MTNKGQFKTLRVLDGKEYVELAEVQEVLKNLTNFQSAIRDVSDALKTVKKISSTLDKVSTDF